MEIFLLRKNDGNNLVLELVISGWGNHMDTKVIKGLQKKGTLRKEFCTLSGVIKIRLDLIRLISIVSW